VIEPTRLYLVLMFGSDGALRETARFRTPDDAKQVVPLWGPIGAIYRVADGEPLDLVDVWTRRYGWLGPPATDHSRSIGETGQTALDEKAAERELSAGPATGGRG
jgi:hypothetical protein